MPVEEISLAVFNAADPAESQLEQEAAVQFAASTLFDLLPPGSSFPLAAGGLVMPIETVREKMKEVSHVNVRGAMSFLAELFSKVMPEEVESGRLLRQQQAGQSQGGGAGGVEGMPVATSVSIPRLKELESILRQGFGCVVTDNDGGYHYLQAFPPFTKADFLAATTAAQPKGPTSTGLCSGILYSPKVGKCQLFSYDTDEIRAMTAECTTSLPGTLLEALGTSLYSSIMERRRPAFNRRTLLYLTAPVDWAGTGNQSAAGTRGSTVDIHCSGIYEPTALPITPSEEEGKGAATPVETKTIVATGKEEVKGGVATATETALVHERESGEKETQLQRPRKMLKLTPSILIWMNSIHDQLTKCKSHSVGSTWVQVDTCGAAVEGRPVSSQRQSTLGSAVLYRLGARMAVSISDGMEQLASSQRHRPRSQQQQQFLPDRLPQSGAHSFESGMTNLVQDGTAVITDEDVNNLTQFVRLELNGDNPESGAAVDSSSACSPLEKELKKFQEALSYLGQPNYNKATGKSQVYHSILLLTADHHSDDAAAKVRDNPASEHGEEKSFLLITLVPESIAGGYVVISFISTTSDQAVTGLAKFFFVRSLSDLRLQEALHGLAEQQILKTGTSQNQEYATERTCAFLFGFNPSLPTCAHSIHIAIPSGVKENIAPSLQTGSTAGASEQQHQEETHGAKYLAAIAEKLETVRAEKLRKLAALQKELEVAETANLESQSALDSLNSDFEVLDDCRKMDQIVDRLEREGESKGCLDSARQVQKRMVNGKLSDRKLDLEKKRKANESTRATLKAVRERLIHDTNNLSFSSPRQAEQSGSESSQSTRQTSQPTSASRTSSTGAFTSNQPPKQSGSTTRPAGAATTNGPRPVAAPTGNKGKTLSDRELAMELQRQMELEQRDREYAKSLQFLED